MLAHDFENIVNKYIKRHNLIETGNSVIVALSGGADSVALLAVLTRLGYNCTAAHCDFHLRGDESERDREFAQLTAGNMGATYREIHFDTETYRRQNGVSLEMACRELRYNWFSQLSHESGTGHPIPVAVAHHFDDNVETMFLNLLRGTGPSGLRGMLPKTGRGIIRPFLEISRKDIVDYLRQIGTSYVTDSSNLKNDVLRNRLRNIILPAIYSQFTDGHRGIATTIENMASVEALLNDHLDVCREKFCHIANDNTIHINLKDLVSGSSSPKSLLYELLKEKGINYTQACNAIESWKNSGATGRCFNTPSHEILINRDELVVAPHTGNYNTSISTNNLLGSKLPDGFSARLIKKSEVKFSRDATKIFLSERVINEKAEFTFRHWQHGDRIHPFGMKGSKLLSDIFSDAHISLRQKRAIWVVTVNDKIIWVPGIRTSAHYTIGENDKQVLEISATDLICKI